MEKWRENPPYSIRQSGQETHPQRTAVCGSINTIRQNDARTFNLRNLVQNSMMTSAPRHTVEGLSELRVGPGGSLLSCKQLPAFASYTKMGLNSVSDYDEALQLEFLNSRNLAVNFNSAFTPLQSNPLKICIHRILKTVIS